MARWKTGSPKKTNPIPNVAVFINAWLDVARASNSAVPRTVPSRTRGVLDENGGVGESALGCHQCLHILSRVLGSLTSQNAHKYRRHRL